MSSINPYRRRADPIAVAVERPKKSSSAFPRHGIQAPKHLLLDEERPFQGTVIAGKSHAAARRVVSSAEIGKFERHPTPLRLSVSSPTGVQNPVLVLSF